VGNGDILDFHVRNDEGKKDEKVHVNKRIICFFLHEATGYLPKKVKHIPASMEGYNADDKYKGTEEYGDRHNDDSAWSIKFSDTDYSSVIVESGDGSYYRKEYAGDERKKFDKDEFLFSQSQINEGGGANVYITQYVGPN